MTEAPVGRRRWRTKAPGYRENGERFPGEFMGRESFLFLPLSLSLVFISFPLRVCCRCCCCPYMSAYILSGGGSSFFVSGAAAAAAASAGERIPPRWPLAGTDGHSVDCEPSAGPVAPSRPRQCVPALAVVIVCACVVKEFALFCLSFDAPGDRVEIDRRLAASLVAHAFFSTFPRRTVKTHPTLLDFNLAGHFFHHLHR